MRTAATLALTLACLATPALAQSPPADALAKDPAVQGSQDPMPAPQGTRPPGAGMTDTGNAPLAQALHAIWASPVDLQGRPIPDAGALAAPPKAAEDAGRR